MKYSEWYWKLRHNGTWSNRSNEICTNNTYCDVEDKFSRYKFDRLNLYELLFIYRIMKIINKTVKFLKNHTVYT